MTTETPELSVLVVDGSATFRESVRRVLETEPGLRVLALVGTEKEAFKMFFRHRPDAVVVEASLPELGGFELLRAIRQADSSCLLILVGKQPDPFVAEVGRLIGADHFWNKADGVESMLEILRKSVRRISTTNAVAV